MNELNLFHEFAEFIQALHRLAHAESNRANSERHLAEAILALASALDNHKPRLTRISIAFGGTMPVQGPVTLVVGDTTVASVVGFDQFGAAWTGTIPPVTYTLDNPTLDSSTPNPDGITSAIVSLAVGVANLTAALTTAERTSLTDTETITNTPANTPTPVLSSIKLAFGA